MCSPSSLFENLIQGMRTERLDWTPKRSHRLYVWMALISTLSSVLLKRQTTTDYNYGVCSISFCRDTGTMICTPLKSSPLASLSSSWKPEYALMHAGTSFFLLEASLFEFASVTPEVSHLLRLVKHPCIFSSDTGKLVITRWTCASQSSLDGDCFGRGARERVSGTNISLPTAL